MFISNEELTEGETGEEKPALVTPQAKEILSKVEGTLGTPIPFQILWNFDMQRCEHSKRKGGVKSFSCLNYSRFYLR